MASFLAAACISIVVSLTLLALVEARRRRKTAAGAGKTEDDGTTEEGRKVLPPGSLGLPFLGETLQLYSQNPKTFFASRLKRYYNKCPIATR